MTIEPVRTPTLEAPDDELADFLELISFFNEFGIARLDVLDGSNSTQAENEYLDFDDESNEGNSEDFGDIDIAREALRDRIENEIMTRCAGCEDSYPFSLSADGEELELKENWGDEKYAAYLTCLLASHMSGSSILQFDVPNDLVQRLRNRVFQVVSTLSLSGFVQGPAASIGWPREDKATILETLNRAQQRGSGFVVRVEPGPYASPRAKDGGIDVVAWRIENVPPPTYFCYGQVASGRNWEGKPVSYHRDNFEENYMLHRPMVERNSATIMPFRVLDQDTWYQEHNGHGRILERTRVHKYVAIGIRQIQEGLETDEADGLPTVCDWIADFREQALA